jgi:putative RecB family exonuclease
MELELDPADLVDEINVGAVGADGRPSPPPRLSPSGASTYEQCPRRWRFRYVDRLPDPPGVPALAGSFAHRVLELLLQHEPAERTRDRAKELARQVWPEVEADDDFRSLELDDNAGRDFRWKSWLAIEGLWAIEDPTAVDVRATEHDIEALLGGVPFRGIVDRLDQESDGVVVTDYKSGKAPPARYAPARLAQVLLYAAAVRESTGEQPVRARLLYLGQKIVDVVVTDSELQAVIDSLGSTWSAIGESCETDTFEPRPGPLCGWCPFADRCPEGREEIDRRAARQADEQAALLSLAG